MLARKQTYSAPAAPLKAPWLKQKEEQRLKDLERDRRARAGQFGALAYDSESDEEDESSKLDPIKSPNMAMPKISEKQLAIEIGLRNGTLNWADVESDDDDYTEF